jgi:hypothetical protein
LWHITMSVHMPLVKTNAKGIEFGRGIFRNCTV